MDDPTKDTIPRSAVEYCLRKETVNTNPDAYEAHGKFIAYMDDPDISQFGHWKHSNGFNCALTTVKCDLDKIPSAQPEQRWIPCSERLPEEKDAGILKKLGINKRSDYVIATVKVKGERMTLTACTLDGVWYWDMKYAFPDYEVVAWQPLPKPYTEDENNG